MKSRFALGAVIAAAIATFLALGSGPLVAQSSSNAAGGSSTAAPATPTAATGPVDVARGKEVYATRGGCVFCHGWAGDGTGSNPRHEGDVANLRETQLTTQELMEVIRCGRPGTAMPYHDNQAYVDDRCYGLTKADLGETQIHKGPSIKEQDIANIAAYIEEHFKPLAGKPISMAECEEFFKPGARPCQGLPK